jgi:DNA polymerase elongation subunit (family B)
LKPLLAALGEADMVTGHNIRRFDLPVIQAEVMRLGLPSLEPVLAQDTIKLRTSKGFKKGQDVLGRLYRIADEKLSLDWQAWQDAYDEDGWQTIRDRAESDVAMHKQLRSALLELDYLKEPRRWSP